MRLSVSFTLLLVVSTCYCQTRYYTGSLPRNSNGGFKSSLKNKVNTAAISKKPTQGGTSSRVLDAKNRLASTITNFALKLDRVLDESQSGIQDLTLFSPASLMTTIALVMLGSGGETFKEIANFLGKDAGIQIARNSEVYHQFLGNILEEINQMKKLNPEQPKTEFAFGIFKQSELPVSKEFLAASKKIYKSDMTSVDFARNGINAKKIINDWVNKKTHGMIKKLLDAPPSSLTKVLVASTLYFNGEWNQHFIDGSTRRSSFVVNSDETIYVDLMHNGGEFPFYEDKKLGAKIIAFPYKGRDVSMYAMLPTETGTKGVKNLKSKLNPEVIENLIDNMNISECIIGYPKMKLSSSLNLRFALNKLNLTSLFDQQTADLSVFSPGREGNIAPKTLDSSASADPGVMHFQNAFNEWSAPSKPGVMKFQNAFSTWDSSGHRYKRQAPPIKIEKFGIDDLRKSGDLKNPGIYADDVIHNVEMTVIETGTEAAAATSTILDRSGGQKRFMANRPFLFFIRHNPTKTILFWATVNRPTPYSKS